MIYLDTSAVIKLLVAGPESAALVDWLAAHDTEVIVSSALLRVEPFGALHRINAAGRSARRSTRTVRRAGSTVHLDGRIHRGRAISRMS